MKSIDSVDILIGVISVMGGVISFLGAYIIKRLTKGNELLISIDKNQALQSMAIENNTKSIEKIESRTINDSVESRLKMEYLEDENQKKDLALLKLSNEVSNLKEKLSETKGS